MNTLKDLLKLPRDKVYSEVKSYAQWRILAPRFDVGNGGSTLSPPERAAKRLVKRGILKPEGAWDNAGYEIVMIDHKLYSVPLKWVNYPTAQRPTKVQQYRDAQIGCLKSFIRDFFYLRRIESVTLDDTKIPHIAATPGIRKYHRATDVHGPATWTAHFRKGTSDFLVLSAERECEIVEDITIRQVTGWWKTEIKEGTNLPVTAWLAVSGDIKTVTRSRNTAITGLRTRITNKVMNSITA